jgi:isoleucyl-tRNA synthetase
MDQLSNWYVRRNRRRFWKSEKGRDKTAAYQTLHECLLTITKLIAPFAPFLSDELYHNLMIGNKSAFESVHLETLPKADAGVINPELEHRMEYAIRIVGIVRAMRMKSNLKVRQPLQKILIPVKDKSESDILKKIKDVILEETNVKELDVHVDDDIIKKKIKPNFKVLGQKHGKLTSKIAERIRSFNKIEIGKLDVEGLINVDVDGNTIEVKREDAEIIAEDIEGWLVGQDGSTTVALATALTDELVDEGLAREFVNRVQNLRKDSGFEVTDRIRIRHASSGRLNKALDRMTEYVKQETLAVEFQVFSNEDARKNEAKSEDINGEQSFIAVVRI